MLTVALLLLMLGTVLMTLGAVAHEHPEIF